MMVFAKSFTISKFYSKNSAFYGDSWTGTICVQGIPQTHSTLVTTSINPGIRLLWFIRGGINSSLRSPLGAYITTLLLKSDRFGKIRNR
jgi:hypothetical protein